MLELATDKSEDSTYGVLFCASKCTMIQRIAVKEIKFLTNLVENIRRLLGNNPQCQREMLSIAQGG